MVDPIISLAAALVLAWILAAAGVHKFRDRARFGASLQAYDLLPAVLVPVAVTVLPVLELLVAAALLVPATRIPAGIAAALLIGTYTLAIGINLARGRRTIDCGCGDPAQRQPLSEWLLLRNGALIGLALLLIGPDAGRSMGWLDCSIAFLAALTVGLIHGAGNQLLANRELLSNPGSSHGHA